MFSCAPAGVEKRSWLEKHPKKSQGSLGENSSVRSWILQTTEGFSGPNPGQQGRRVMLAGSGLPPVPSSRPVPSVRPLRGTGSCRRPPQPPPAVRPPRPRPQPLHGQICLQGKAGIWALDVSPGQSAAARRGRRQRPLLSLFVSGASRRARGCRPPPPPFLRPRRGKGRRGHRGARGRDAEGGSAAAEGNAEGRGSAGGAGGRAAEGGELEALSGEDAAGWGHRSWESGRGRPQRDTPAERGRGRRAEEAGGGAEGWARWGGPGHCRGPGPAPGPTSPRCRLLLPPPPPRSPPLPPPLEVLLQIITCPLPLPPHLRGSCAAAGAPGRGGERCRPPGGDRKSVV